MIVIKSVLVATDFSDPSTTALNYARAMARAFGGTLHVLHVFEPVWITSTDVIGGGAAIATMIDGLEDTAKQQLTECVTDEDRRDLQAVEAFIVSDSTAREIAQYASDQKIDLVVIGTHGKAGISRVLLGSVAEKIVRLAPCPVLTVHHPEREFVLPDAVPPARQAGSAPH